MNPSFRPRVRRALVSGAHCHDRLKAGLEDKVSCCAWLRPPSSTDPAELAELNGGVPSPRECSHASGEMSTGSLSGGNMFDTHSGNASGYR